MSTYLALLIIGTFVAGTIAGPGQVVDWRSRGTTTEELEKRLNNLESECVNKDYLSALNRRIDNLERRQIAFFKEADDKAQKTNQRFAKMQDDNMNLLNKMTERHEVETKAAMTQNANLMHALNESLNTIETGLCRSGIFGTDYFPGIENTWPRTYHVVFEPPFKYHPQFAFGINYLDSSYVRVYSNIKELGVSYAKIQVGTWQAKNLYGVSYRWMACP